MVEKLSYNETNEEHVLDAIFTTGENQNFSQAIGVLNKHVYDYVITDSGVEKKFVEQLDTSASLQLKGMEEQKIACARKFFEKLGAAQAGSERIRYDVVDSFERLMDLVAA